MAVNIDVRDGMKQFELGQYKGLNVDRFDVSVKEEELNEALNYVKKSLDEIQIEKNNEPIETGDYVIVNFEGTENGKTVPKFRERGFKFRLGDENVLQEFSANLLSKKMGETVIFETTIQPVLLEYQALWGKQITFSVEIVKVYCMKEPELTDDMIRKIEPRVKTLQELKQFLAAEINQEKKAIARAANIEKVFQALADGSKYEFDEETLKQAAEDLYRKFAEELKAVHDMELIHYLMQRKITADELLAECKEESAKIILGEKILDAVIQAEGIQLTGEEMKQAKEQLKKRKSQRDDQAADLAGELKMLETQQLRRTAMDFLLKANLARR
ncbi:Cell division trigger factor [Dehalobacter sp. UNSWDHB]|uniref:FKBP-type peptidyl-prolyl cis-trans isomerase n=1 Tax=Dehalobacter sp. UNSWDHB TaxID=1339256 RepID=UPI000387573F|nr:FKBP-type peptidyl-prolyl cis-trans isomerase [Dehalobacter sp. UNSWDHB]EQB21432.1 Cell division trigger factor [Dehalobacter sp. UNSWDHB]